MTTAETPAGLVLGEDGLARCFWAKSSAPDYVRYHDEEWARPVFDDRRLFEKLCLEGFQAGLSWLTVLRKRPRFREVFADFEPKVVAGFDADRVAELLQDPGIIRHRGKIEAVIHNAQAMDALVAEFGSLSTYAWGFVPPAAERPKRMTYEAVRSLAKTPTSERLSRDLKRRGFRFVGPTTCYAFMQAMGLVNDHLQGCCVRPAVERAQRARPAVTTLRR